MASAQGYSDAGADAGAAAAASDGAPPASNGSSSMNCDAVATSTRKRVKRIIASIRLTAPCDQLAAKPDAFRASSRRDRKKLTISLRSTAPLLTAPSKNADSCKRGCQPSAPQVASGLRRLPSPPTRRAKSRHTEPPLKAHSEPSSPFRRRGNGPPILRCDV